MVAEAEAEAVADQVVEAQARNWAGLTTYVGRSARAAVSQDTTAFCMRSPRISSSGLSSRQSRFISYTHDSAVWWTLTVR